MESNGGLLHYVPCKSARQALHVLFGEGTLISEKTLALPFVHRALPGDAEPCADGGRQVRAVLRSPIDGARRDRCGCTLFFEKFSAPTDARSAADRCELGSSCSVTAAVSLGEWRAASRRCSNELGISMVLPFFEPLSQSLKFRLARRRPVWQLPAGDDGQLQAGCGGWPLHGDHLPQSAPRQLHPGACPAPTCR